MSSRSTAVPSHKQLPQHARNGGVLQNGYQLRHYHYAGNERLDKLYEVKAMLETATDEQFSAEVKRAQHLVQTAAPCQHLIRQYPQEWQTWLGFAPESNITELMASGNRTQALAAIDDYLQRWRAVRERADPDGLKEERTLELTDRERTEEKRKQRNVDARVRFVSQVYAEDGGRCDDCCGKKESCTREWLE